MLGYRRNSSVCSTTTSEAPCVGSDRWLTSPSSVSSGQSGRSVSSAITERMSVATSPAPTSIRCQNRRSGVQREVIGRLRQRSSPRVCSFAPIRTASTKAGLLCTARTRSGGMSPPPGRSQSGRCRTGSATAECRARGRRPARRGPARAIRRARRARGRRRPAGRRLGRRPLRPTRRTPRDQGARSPPSADPRRGCPLLPRPRRRPGANG